MFSTLPALMKFNEECIFKMEEVIHTGSGIKIEIKNLIIQKFYKELSKKYE